jgi:ankyrin repeat protein
MREIILGATPLYIAAKKGHALLQAMCTPRDMALIKMGCRCKRKRDVNTRDGGATPMLVAAQNGHSAVIAALLEAGADASIKTKWGTALEIAKKGEKPGTSESG